jgi:hypothetical protein
MRPFRLFFIVVTSVVALILLISVTRGHRQNEQSFQAQRASRPSALRSMFSFRSPLFPSSAIISLTDDNSTFFLSRPAAFGPDLPTKGLSGQLWIGSGFGEDPRGWVGVTSLPEGELGCSDVPGWDETLSKFGSGVADINVKNKLAIPVESKDSLTREADRARRSMKEGSKTKSNTDLQVSAKDDGTDNYLFQPGEITPDTSDPEDNADIQSLQESAEIAGKVVLLSRGGCGFLDKAKWTQRRGGVALIVGDNVPGGPLVTMYAQGDTSNITIPALFTSHTTAHLLSSLIPLKNGGSLTSTAASDDKTSDKSKDKLLKSTGSTKTSQEEHEKTSHASSSRGFFKTLFSIFGPFGRDSSSKDNTRPPHSVDHDWVLVEDWENNGATIPSLNDEKGQSKNTQDNFVIGVQDWRDPGLTKKPNNPGIARKQKTSTPKVKRFAGGSTTPSSGEYRRDSNVMPKEGNKKKDQSSSDKAVLDSKPASKNTHPYIKPGSISSADNDESKSIKAEAKTIPDEPPKALHEGLWVTLTPTNMSTSPFFDTILVLVISPLITLTVVYAVLLIRSRIRRRRWRAPKSVVDQLPVRTYHTISSSGASSTALATPVAQSPTTPLLQHTSSELRPSLSRSHSRTRPRSRTTSEVPGPSSYISDDDDDFISQTESDKREKGLAAWRRRYGGRQKDCVVCLEEYVDGVSRVMSLPCGHEFHQECITPWLTTRRRTCPICKGDVVRSLTRHSAGSYARSSLIPFNSSDDDDGMQARVAVTRNDSPSAHEPVPVEQEDLEQADLHADDEQTVSEWLAEWWQRVRHSRWERLDPRRTRGRTRRADMDPDRDR